MNRLCKKFSSTLILFSLQKFYLTFCISYHSLENVSNFQCWDFWKIYLSAKKLKVEIFTYAFRQNFSLAQCASLLFAGGWGVGVKGLSLLPNFQKREGLRGSQFCGGGGGLWGRREFTFFREGCSFYIKINKNLKYLMTIKSLYTNGGLLKS